MCFQNSKEVNLSCSDWSKMFPDGISDTYTDFDPPIETSLLDMTRGVVKNFIAEAPTRVATVAARDDSCRTIQNFAWLAAQRSLE